METTISSKYQVVIPKAIRRKHGFLPGQKMNVSEDARGLITLRPVTSLATPHQQLLKKYAGAIKNSPWGKDPVAHVRKLRSEWD